MSVSHLSTQQKDYQQVASNCLLLPGSAKSITPPGGFLFFFAQVQLTTQTQLATPGSTHTQMFVIDIITFPSLHQHMPTPQGGCPGGDTLDPHSVSKEMTKGDAFFFFKIKFLKLLSSLGCGTNLGANLDHTIHSFPRLLHPQHLCYTKVRPMQAPSAQLCLALIQSFPVSTVNALFSF